jgi:hypothetical protein|tara:strand:- start:940 stop:1647 length:708 start_codon:yes stop_codon:yes gene_type:complete
VSQTTAGRATVLLLLLAFLPHSLASEEWKLLKEQQGIRVYSQKVAGSRYDAFKGIVELRAPLASILGLLEHTEACPEWVHSCILGRTLASNGFSKRYTYQVLDLPFPLAKRDSVVEAITSHNGVTGAITITLTAAADYYPATKHVRIRVTSGSFHLDPIDEDRTEVTWQLHTDPAGFIPAFLVNMLLVDIPFQSLQRMEEMVKTAPYKRVAIKYDADGSPIDLLHRSWPLPEAVE